MLRVGMEMLLFGAGNEISRQHRDSLQEDQDRLCAMVEDPDLRDEIVSMINAAFAAGEVAGFELGVEFARDPRPFIFEQSAPVEWSSVFVESGD